uniref:RxLR effector candidate protein n=1 Tax=Hyaloperonospora arabidopsidis (strain Emoy2) TaxID=559515 RepID=M4BLH0_HYAAE
MMRTGKSFLLAILASGFHSIEKRAAIDIESDAWNQAICGRISTAGFEAAGLFPLLYPQMMERVQLFNNGGAGRAAQRAKMISIQQWYQRC